jgi:hypothetical protein
VPAGVAPAACTKRSDGAGEEVRDGAMGRRRRRGSGTMMGISPAASRPKTGSRMGLATAMARRQGRQRRDRGRRHRWRGVEGGSGGTDGGGGVEGGKIGQPDRAKPNFTVIRVSCQWCYSPSTRYIIGIG